MKDDVYQGVIITCPACGEVVPIQKSYIVHAPHQGQLTCSLGCARYIRNQDIYQDVKTQTIISRFRRFLRKNPNKAKEIIQLAKGG